MKIKHTLLNLLMMILFICLSFGQSMQVQAKTVVGKASINVISANHSFDLKVKWKKISNASGYKVYMATSKNGKFTEINTTKKTSYTVGSLKKNKTYYFKVKAYKIVDGKKKYGSYSNVVKYKTSKYPLYQVFDEGGDNVYFYYTSASYDENKSKECLSQMMKILSSRHPIPEGATGKQIETGSDHMGYNSEQGHIWKEVFTNIKFIY